MEKYPFIFSDKLRYRLQRHLLFWACWWLFSSIIYSFSAGILNISYSKRFPVAALEAFFYLIPHMLLSYSLLYIIIPRLLLKGKYLKTVMAVLLMFLLTAATSTFVGLFVLAPARTLFVREITYPVHPYEISFFLGLLAGLRGGITVGGIAAAIKLSKYWYAKEQRNLQLQKENLTTQLQLLKAQVHPHFLFNTLNNIYSNTQVTSPAAAGMIMGLSQLLRYILYECNQPLVPLSRELKMLEEYVALEKTRYGNDLEIHLEFPAEQAEYAIAPLVLLPFVENCFKHGTSTMLEQPWISLHISIEDGWLKMKLLNGKADEASSSATGIGLSNVTKRLELLYTGKHELMVTNEAEVYVVNLKLLLDRNSIITNSGIAKTTTEVYA